jgi:hypothetical protein
MGVTVGIVCFAHSDNAEQEGQHLVRVSRADLNRRINGDLALRYEASGRRPVGDAGIGPESSTDAAYSRALASGI